MVAHDSCTSMSSLFYVTDKLVSHSFLADTGAEVSVIPTIRIDRQRSAISHPLQAVNNSKICTYGQCSLTLDLSLNHTFWWVFIVTDFHLAILGADFLRTYGHSINVRLRHLIDTTTFISVKELLVPVTTWTAPHVPLTTLT